MNENPDIELVKTPSDLELLETARTNSTPVEVKINLEEVDLLIDHKRQELDTDWGGNDMKAILEEFLDLVKIQDSLKAKKSTIATATQVLRTDQILLIMDAGRTLQAEIAAKGKSTTKILNNLLSLEKVLSKSKTIPKKAKPRSKKQDK